MTTQQFKQRLQRLLDDWHRYVDDAAHHWDMHANRRTLVLLIVSGSLFAYVYVSAIEPPDQFPLNTIVSIEPGTSVTAIASTLQREQVIRSPLMFRILVIMMGSQRNVHAGDYLFTEPLDAFSLAHALVVGRYGLEPTHVRIPEGATVKQMAAIYDRVLLKFDPNTFTTSASALEGYLFPDTYNFLPNASESMVIDAMHQNFEDKIAPLSQELASSSHSLTDIVTMASIVEREAFNTTDRKLIAGVLWNRLAKGMPLQVDVTFGYTLGKGTFQLTMKDLTTPSPYNTYVNKGLPPTPIGSPSLDSIRAALEPTPSKYLYFLADHQGITHYCETYSCQLANKARYFR